MNDQFPEFHSLTMLTGRIGEVQFSKLIWSDCLDFTTAESFGLLGPKFHNTVQGHSASSGTVLVQWYMSNGSLFDKKRFQIGDTNRNEREFRNLSSGLQRSHPPFTVGRSLHTKRPWYTGAISPLSSQEDSFSQLAVRKRTKSDASILDWIAATWFASETTFILSLWD